MNKGFCILFLMLILGLNVSCVATGNNPLKFNEQGKLKIAQFTDIHYKPGDPESDPSVELIKYILAAEKPDLVVFTGDIVCGAPLTDGWKAVLAPVTDAGLPFAFTPGNHDDEHDLTRDEIFTLLKSFPGFLGNNPGALSGWGDYLIELHDGENTRAALLYFMDSKAYSTREGIEGYGWFSHDQVAWYREQSRKHALDDGSRLPALAFFHIPLPEYRQAFNSDAFRTGQRNEDECPPEINTGMFSAILLEGDVMGTFVGHDHVNDYLVNHYGIGLAYGRWSGGKTTYGDLQHGSRIIVLEQGQKKFETWIRLRDGQVVDKIVFPDGLQ